MARRREPQAKMLEDGTLMLYGVIGDEWDGLTAARVVEDIRGLGAVDELTVLINSPGGLVTDGLAIHHELLTNPAKVTVEITGVAASMGSAIAMAGDTVRMSKNAHLMIHDPWNVAVGDADDLRKAADVLDEFGTSLVDIYAAKTGLPTDEIRDMMAVETWLTAEEAKAKGFVDEIIGEADAEAFADLDIGELASVPAALTRLIREGKQMARERAKNGGEATEPKVPATPEPQEREEATSEPVTAQAQATDVDSRVEAILAAERKRGAEIRGIAAKLALGDRWANARIDAGDTVETARAAALDEVVARQERDGGPSPFPHRVEVGADETDKFREGAAAWLIVKSGRASLVQKHSGQTLDPGEFGGMSLLDLARESLHRGGISTKGMSKMEVAKRALRGPRADAGLGTTSDFPILLENALHKMLQAAYGTAPDTWRSFCAQGSVSDFKAHPRLRLGSLATLDTLLESGEFKRKHFPDAERETISAGTKGNTIGLTRQSVVNDDVDGFSRLVFMLGRAAARSIEVDVYALLAQNAGMGPTMADGNALFNAAHNNVGAGAALSAAAIDADRVIMASQTDPDGNDFLDLRPEVLLVPIGLGSTARTVNQAQYDPDNVGSFAPNTVNGLFSTIVDTPRLAGTRRYMFADPDIAPVIEVVFLDGQSAPVIETEDPFEYDGYLWKVRFDYGTDATDWRGALTDAGV